MDRPYEECECGCRVYGNWFDGSTHYQPWVDESDCDGSCSGSEQEQG